MSGVRCPMCDYDIDDCTCEDRTGAAQSVFSAMGMEEAKMPSLLERLRVGPPTFAGEEGAAEIERLRAEIELLDSIRNYAAAAYRAGAEQMRERAAQVADEYEGGREPGESIRLLTIDEGNK